MNKILHRWLAAASIFAVSGASAAACPATIGAICLGDAVVDDTALIAHLRTADIVILGERHDNPGHHQLQANLVAALAPMGLAFEMVPRAKEAAANAARAEGVDLAAALDWANSGWPDWEMYEDIFDAAPAAEIAGGGVPKDRLRQSVKIGAAAAWPEGAIRYRLNERLPEKIMEAMIEEQDIAHCGGLPTAMLPGMVEAQQLRDAAFADAALRLHEAGRRPVVLITGNGHARTDRGAPLYLRRAAPDLVVVSVGLIEAGAQSGAPFDVEIHTAAHDRGDPCAEFLKSREKAAD